MPCRTQGHDDECDRNTASLFVCVLENNGADGLACPKWTNCRKREALGTPMPGCWIHLSSLFAPWLAAFSIMLVFRVQHWTCYLCSSPRWSPLPCPPIGDRNTRLCYVQTFSNDDNNRLACAMGLRAFCAAILAVFFYLRLWRYGGTMSGVSICNTLSRLCSHAAVREVSLPQRKQVIGSIRCSSYTPALMQ